MDPLTILSLVRDHWRTALVIAIAAALYGAGWKMRGRIADGDIAAIKFDHEQAMTAAANSYADQLLAAQQKSTELRNHIASIDKVHSEEIEHARLEASNLRECIRTGRCRLSIPTKSTSCGGGSGLPSTSIGAGLGTKEARTELDGEAGARIVAITDDGDDAIRQLNACTTILESLTGGQQ